MSHPPQQHFPPELERFLSHVRGVEQRCFQVNSFSTYKVAELKKIAQQLNRMRTTNYEYITSGGHKDALVAKILARIYSDYPRCNALDSELRQHMNAFVSAQGTASATPNANHVAAPAPPSAVSLCLSQSAINPLPLNYETLPPLVLNQHLCGIVKKNHAKKASPQKASTPLRKKASHYKSAQSAPSDCPQRTSIQALQSRSQTTSVAATPTAAVPMPNHVPWSEIQNNSSNQKKTPKQTTTSHKCASPGHRTHTLQTVRVKQEHIDDYTTPDPKPPSTQQQQQQQRFYETQPRTPHENNLLQQLMGMGFTDRFEILSSVRKLTPACGLPTPSPDQVMVDLITQREEAEEARKMDEARRLSELVRKEESRRLRDIKAQEDFERKCRATWNGWLSERDMFDQSWILKHNEFRVNFESVVNSSTDVKKKMMEVLDLEKNARQWYGDELPRSYFRRVLVERVIRKTNRSSRFDAIVEYLIAEVELLQEALYKLSVQQGGVPKIFLDAHTTYENGGMSHDVDDDGEHDEIEVMEVIQNSIPEEIRHITDNCQNQDIIAPTEVIEIL